MTTRADLLPAVYAITDRPDMETQSMLGLSRALTQAHAFSDFRFDLEIEEIANPGTSEFLHTLPDRYQRTKVLGVEGRFEVKEVPISEIFNPSWLAHKNRYYLAGTSMKLFVANAYDKLQHFYFKVPSFEDSFIVAKYGESVIARLAASYVYVDLGAPQQSQQQIQLAQVELAELERKFFAI